MDNVWDGVNTNFTAIEEAILTSFSDFVNSLPVSKAIKKLLLDDSWFFEKCTEPHASDFDYKKVIEKLQLLEKRCYAFALKDETKKYKNFCGDLGSMLLEFMVITPEINNNLPKEPHNESLPKISHLFDEKYIEPSNFDRIVEEIIKLQIPMDDWVVYSQHDCREFWDFSTDEWEYCSNCYFKELKESYEKEDAITKRQKL